MVNHFQIPLTNGHCYRSVYITQPEFNVWTKSLSSSQIFLWLLQYLVVFVRSCTRKKQEKFRPESIDCGKFCCALSIILAGFIVPWFIIFLFENFKSIRNCPQWGLPTLSCLIFGTSWPWNNGRCNNWQWVERRRRFWEVTTEIPDNMPSHDLRYSSLIAKILTNPLQNSLGW